MYWQHTFSCQPESLPLAEPQKHVAATFKMGVVDHKGATAEIQFRRLRHASAQPSLQHRPIWQIRPRTPEIGLWPAADTARESHYTVEHFLTGRFPEILFRKRSSLGVCQPARRRRLFSRPGGYSNQPPGINQGPPFRPQLFQRCVHAARSAPCNAAAAQDNTIQFHTIFGARQRNRL